ncbi:Arp2/3 complex, 34 kd subunit p34-Arc-domain-containing protein [Pavlovales sp. CCMP2436]|nr:Arp2/3 complex, 34 kd subunit p34-Arc-domain-containing protein [Pavlovales sp. CCMP2436]
MLGALATQAKSAGGMIHMDPGNGIVAETIRSQIDSETRHAVDVTAADHNDVLYKVASDLDAKHLLTVSISISCFAEVIEQVGADFLTMRYGSLLCPTAEIGFSVSLQLNLDDLAAADEKKRAETIALASCLRRDIEGAPLWVCFGALLNRTPVPRPLYVVHPRPLEPLYIAPGMDRVVVIYTMSFKDPTELAIASIFLQELELVRRTEKSLSTAPLVSLSTRPPAAGAKPCGPRQAKLRAKNGRRAHLQARRHRECSHDVLSATFRVSVCSAKVP